MREEMHIWNLRQYGDLPAVVTSQGEMFSYRDLDGMQDEFARRIRSGALVCVLADNDVPSLVAYLSCLMNRIVLVMLPADGFLPVGEMITREYEPDYVWLSVARHRKSSDLFRSFKETFSWDGYRLLEREGRTERELHPDLALLLPTSGSAGRVRLVRLSRGNVLANTVSICSYMKLTRSDRAVSSLPMGYTYGLSVVNTMLRCGGSILLTKTSIVRHPFWEDMHGFGITVFSGVPFMYESMRKLNVNIGRLDSLRMMTQAGGKLSEELQRYWGRRTSAAGKEFLVMYGQTEATARISYLPARDCLGKVGSVGIAVPGSVVELLGESGDRVRCAYEEGEIVCRGQQVGMGYAERKEDLALGDLNGGCLHTGDVGYFDEDEYLYITGRMNRFAKILGKRLDLVLIEKTACEIWGREVTATSDDKNVYLYMDVQCKGEDLVMLEKHTGCRRDLFVIRQRNQIPRLYNGKIKYGGV